MMDISIVTQLPLWTFPLGRSKTLEKPPDLHALWQFPQHLPQAITDSPTVMRCFEWLAPLDWAHFPERNLQRNWGQSQTPYAALAAAELIRLNENKSSTESLHEFLIEHPGFISLLGFPLADSVRLIRAELHARKIPEVDCVSLDTKHILAWVKENNPKAYAADRFNKKKQPAGDPDCRLGCKRRHNRVAMPTTPSHNPVSAATLKVGEYHWGYGSGVVVAKIPDYGEFVLAEMTQPFDHGDVTYFFPLMTQTEERLGYRPRYATLDAAFDAWYVYAYFYRENEPDFGFAAVPFSEKGNYKAKQRQFAPTGEPRCAAGLTMPLQFTYTDRTTCLVEHERGKYVCPLKVQADRRRTCPVRHPNWKKEGCTAMMPISMGARLRYTLDRDSELYQQLYRQRTAVERINSQAVALGIERPHLRNGQAIANQNTLIYVLINLRFLQRLRRGLREDA
jgi:hypothetical protein